MLRKLTQCSADVPAVCLWSSVFKASFLDSITEKMLLVRAEKQSLSIMSEQVDKKTSPSE